MFYEMSKFNWKKIGAKSGWFKKNRSTDHFDYDFEEKLVLLKGVEHLTSGTAIIGYSIDEQKESMWEPGYIDVIIDTVEIAKIDDLSCLNDDVVCEQHSSHSDELQVGLIIKQLEDSLENDEKLKRLILNHYDNNR